jgi:protein-disulfide isomerase
MEIESAKLTLPVSTRRDHIQGPDAAPATLVEYGDYECPYCGQAYVIIKQVQKLLGKDLRFVFRNFPLTQVHPHAQHSAEAAESAAAQNKFWEMHDYLYEHQQALDDEHLVQYATLLGLNLSKFVSDMSNHRLFISTEYVTIILGTWRLFQNHLDTLSSKLSNKN